MILDRGMDLIIIDVVRQTWRIEFRRLKYLVKSLYLATLMGFGGLLWRVLGLG